MIVRLATAAMGTRFELVLEADDEPAARALGEAALDEVLECHRRLSAFDPGSLLSHVNREAAGRAVAIDEDLWQLLGVCDDVWRASGGAFDPTVGPLMHALGFRGAGPLDAAAVEDARGRTGWPLVELSRPGGVPTVRFARGGVALDLGGVAKGHALDRAAEVLRAGGAGRALMHGGTSTVVAIGAPPGERGWRVAVRGAPGAVATLRDAAMSVSSPAGRIVGDGESRAGHVLDPRSGRSVAACDVAAIACGSAAVSDAWSTATLVEGRRPAGLPRECAGLVAGGVGRESWGDVIEWG